MVPEPEGRALPALAAFRIDPVTGFVPPKEPLRDLGERYSAWEEIAPDLSVLIRSRQVRRALETLPVLRVNHLRDDRRRERAFLLLTVFANAYVWGDDEPACIVPASVSIPLCALAAILDRPPIVHYASMALNNWRLVSQAGGIAADNMTMQVQFLGGADEDWFFIGSLAVELAGAPVIGAAHAAAVASRNGSDADLAEQLVILAGGLGPVLQALETMRAWCDPYVFCRRVRPFLSGWPHPGVTYAGVSSDPQKFAGGSAGQSSLLQSIDAALGVRHEASRAGDYLRRMRAYMPRPHRAFVEQLEVHSLVRDRAAVGSMALRRAYNRAVGQVDRFRDRHMALARDFIGRPSGMSTGERGTGGTDYGQFLGEARLNTRRSRL